ncbi:MAG: hypothetical protein ACRDPE_02155 [Solirubrobacterales bacterium]
MTEARPTGRSGGTAVFWSSAALFAVIFALLTFQLSSAGGSGSTGTTQPVQVRKVIKRRIVTTVVPSPGVTQVNPGPATTATAEVPSEPITTSTS